MSAHHSAMALALAPLILLRMKKITKVILAATFIFPGVGHILLKRYITGVAAIAIALAALVPILIQVFSIALDISERIVTGAVEPNFLVIRELIKEQQAATETQLVGIAIYVLVMVWLASIVDSYRVAKGQEHTEASKESS